MHLLIVLYSYIILATIGSAFLLTTSYAHRYGISFVLLCGVLLALYTRFIEPYLLHVKRITIDSHQNLAQPITIALLADIQVSRYKAASWVKKITDQTTTLNPDLVLIAGDLINNQHPHEDEIAHLEPLRTLTTTTPTYYVLGNHDYGFGKHYFGEKTFQKYDDRSEAVKQKMSTLGATLLQNSLASITIRNTTLSIFGSDDLWSRPVTFEAVANQSSDHLLLFLTHNPDTIAHWPHTAPKPLIALAGHTHGGQIAFGPLPIGNASVKLGLRYYHGLRSYRDLPIYISVGLGESTAPLRLSNRPEITLITIT